MAASTNDKITDTRLSARPNSARATGTRSAGGVALACDSLSGWPTASKVHFVTYQIDSNSKPMPGTQLDCRGIISGNTIGSFVVLDGTDNGNSIGDVVEMLPTASWGQDLSDALMVGHTRTGAHVANLSLTSPVLTTPVIADYSSGTHTHASNAQGGQLTGSAIATGSQLADRLLNPYKFSAYLGSGQATGTGGFFKVNLDTENFDTGNNFDAVTNHRFTAPIAGFYQFSGAVQTSADGGNLHHVAALYKNGAEVLRGGEGAYSDNANHQYVVSGLLQLAATDYIELYGYSTSNITTNAGAIATYLTGYIVSAT